MTARLALVGPTATGKSEVAMAAARLLGDVEIVSADSMQVYRGMDVGTAKPTPAERAEVPHHLLDVADPSDDYSVARFQAAALAAVGEIEGRGRRALIVGGTGLYYQALVDRMDLPGDDPGLRARLEARCTGPDALAELHRELAERDPVAAGRIDPRNQRRLVRALEVTLSTGRPFSSYGPGVFGAGDGGAGPAGRPGPRLGDRGPGAGPVVRAVGLWMPRAVSSARAGKRFAAMLAGGLVEEVEALLASPEGLSRTARQAIGYREVIEALAGGCSLDAALGRAVDRTRQLARRQRMWFRRDPRITWVGTADNPLAVLPAVLALWRTQPATVPSTGAEP